MLFDQHVVPGRVVGHPVQDDVQTQLVGGLHEVLQVVQRAELRVDAVVVLDGVGAAQAALAVPLADGMDRHQPEDVHTQFFEPRQVRLGGPKRALRRELPRVDLIDGRRSCSTLGAGCAPQEWAGNGSGRSWAKSPIRCSKFVVILPATPRPATLVQRALLRRGIGSGCDLTLLYGRCPSVSVTSTSNRWMCGWGMARKWLMVNG